MREDGTGLGLYEPIHGSAPDIAGQGIANPIGMLRCAAMLLRHSLGLTEEAAALEAAVDAVITSGLRTADIAGAGEPTVIRARWPTRSSSGWGRRLQPEGA